jgi:4-hydroxy-4-methyl-2-oxoglutarate aldolase
MFLGKYEIEELKEALYSGLLADVLDHKGFRNQTLDIGIRPTPKTDKMLGTAFTAVGTAVFEIPKEPFKNQLITIDSLKENDVYCGTCGGNDSAAFWGELMATAAKSRGGAGALIDGATRDVAKIEEIGFPVFTRSYRATTAIGRIEVIDYGKQIVLGGVLIKLGDVVFGDFDGVVIVPGDIAVEVIDEALKLLTHENEARALLRKGESMVKVYEALGIL